MAWSRILECPDCSHSWRFLAMTKGQRNPPCPACAAQPAVALAAPAVNRGAAPATTVAIPSGKTAAIDFAMRAISDDNGGANMKTTSRVDEPVALAPALLAPGPAPVAQWGAGGARPAGTVPTINMGNVAALRDGGGEARSALIDNLHRAGGQRDRRQAHMKPVYRDQRK